MKKIITVLCFLFFWMSCENYLEVKPSNFISGDRFYTSIQDLQTALSGAYLNFESDALGGSALSIVPDIMTDNANYLLVLQGLIEMSQNQISSSNGWVEECWLVGYQSINQINLILASLEVIEKRPSEQLKRDEIRGQALFLRGIIYFEMVRLFGKPYGASSGSDLGIPLVDQATVTLSKVTFPMRASVEAVYNQAITDLSQAQKLLPDSGKRGFGSRFAAIGYLAKISFQQRKYEEAALLAKTVLDGSFKLESEPKLFFTNEGSSEEIWSVVHSPQGTNQGLLAYHTQLYNGTRLRLRDDLINNGYLRIVTTRQKAAIMAVGLEAVDLRLRTLTFVIPGGIGFGTSKYEDRTGGDDAPLLRLAELYLMRAEALVRTKGINQESIDLLNAIRTRALRVVNTSGNVVTGGIDIIKFSIADFTTPKELMEAIILERRVELAIEGNYFHDLMRLQRDVKGFPYNADRLRWPIPQREIDANANLVQNPGY